MKTEMNHSQEGGLLKMIRRTDPVISHYVPLWLLGYRKEGKRNVTYRGKVPLEQGKRTFLSNQQRACLLSAAGGDIISSGRCVSRKVSSITGAPVIL